MSTDPFARLTRLPRLRARLGRWREAIPALQSMNGHARVMTKLYADVLGGKDRQPLEVAGIRIGPLHGHASGGSGTDFQEVVIHPLFEVGPDAGGHLRKPGGHRFEGGRGVGRLPPFQPGAVLEPGGIRDGDRVVLRMGPPIVGARWVAVHRDYREGHALGMVGWEGSGPGDGRRT